MGQIECLVRLERLRKSYDGLSYAVDDLSLSIFRGEFLTLLGPSGSGKTTTLMMLAGFERPTSGDIMLEGRSIQDLPPHKRDFGMVFQNYALFPHLSVADNIAFPLAVRKLPRREIGKRLARALEMVQLNGLEQRLPAQLSGGQQQRVALARALVFEPRLVLMDEPLGALDKRLREQMQYEIKGLHRRLGITIVYVTHDQVEAMVLSDRVAVFNHGAIRQLDTPRAIHEAPADGFVARFMGETNSAVGRVETVESGRVSLRLDKGPTVVGICRRPVTPGERIGPPSSFENAFDAVVEDLTYLGDRLVTFVRLACGFALSVDLGIDGLDKMPRHGQSVSVGWAANHCLILDAD
jgi:putative spermidine/putrescine transport system ATP-binding protein